jgi:hypothetical protein
MIAIACATTDERAFRAAGAPTIETLDEGNSLLLRQHHHESVDVPYNAMLATAAARDDLEAIAFVHQLALVDDDGDALTRVRGLLAADPTIAVVGALDAGRPREVTAVPGTLVVLSPWAARNLRFDQSAGGSPDTSARDISLQARAAGRRVVGARLGVSRAWRPATPAERRRELRSMVALGRRLSGLAASGAQAS